MRGSGIVGDLARLGNGESLKVPKQDEGISHPPVKEKFRL